jgi:hypothetical protein
MALAAGNWIGGSSLVGDWRREHAMPIASAWQLKLEAEQSEGLWEGDYCERGDTVVVLVEATTFQQRVQMTVDAQADGARVMLQEPEHAVTYRAAASAQPALALDLSEAFFGSGLEISTSSRSAPSTKERYFP